MIRHCARALFVAFGLCTMPTWVLCAAVEVAPVSHELAPGQAAISMTVTNRADVETTLQVRGYVWTQDGVRDNLVPAADLLVAPAIFNIAPGHSQVLRVRVPAAAAGHEMSYRLLIDELPSPGDASQVRMLLRLSVPVFAQGNAVRAAHLLARIDPAGGTVTLVNEGGRRSRVHELSMILPEGRHLATKPMAGSYVLPGAQRPWAVVDAGHAVTSIAAWKLVALTDDGRVEVPLVASP